MGLSALFSGERFLKIVVTVYRPIGKTQGFARNVFLFQQVCYASARLAGCAIGRPGALESGWLPSYLTGRPKRQGGCPFGTSGTPGAGRRPYLKGGVGGPPDSRLAIRRPPGHNAGGTWDGPQNRLGGHTPKNRLTLAGYVIAIKCSGGPGHGILLQ